MEEDWDETTIQNSEHTVTIIMLLEKWQKGITELSHFCGGYRVRRYTIPLEELNSNCSPRSIMLV